jgi:molybdate transport system regulatory protein
MFYTYNGVYSTMESDSKHNVSCKVWLEYHGHPLIGKGGAEILETINSIKSISKAAKSAGMSYSYVWNYLAKLEKKLGEPVIKTFKGGSEGGGGAELTELGNKLLNEYHRAEWYMHKLVSNQNVWNDTRLEDDTQNRLKGTIQQIEKEVAKVKTKIDAPTVVTAVISKNAVEELNIKSGDTVDVVIKATDVRVTKNK